MLSDGVPDRTEAERIHRVAALDEPARRRVYAFVREHGPVSRHDVAEAARVSPSLAAFHLEKLVRRGLVRAWPERGVRERGRPRKLYAAVDDEVSAGVPDRRYAVLAALLVDALRKGGDAIDWGTLRTAARDHGRSRGRDLSGRVGPPGDQQRSPQVALAAEGYEPRRRADGSLALANCPFGVVAARAPEVVCEMNVDLVAGLLDGLGERGWEAVLDRGEGRCCVTVRRAAG